MLRALKEAGIAPDLVVGTSVGSLNGALVASDYDRAVERLDDMWRSLTRREVMPGRIWVLVRNWRRTHNSVHSNSGLAEIIDRTLGADVRIESFALPFAAVALDIERGLPASFHVGPAREALLASAAIPGVFPPVAVDGRWYYDGGMVASLPIAQAVAMGAKSVVALDCTDPLASLAVPRGVNELVAYLTEVVARQQRSDELLSSVRMLYPPNPTPPGLSPLDFSQSAQLIDGAYTATVKYLREMQAGSWA